MSYKVEVLVAGEWISNALCFATQEEAKAYGQDLSRRWFAVKEWRVVESNEPINYAFRSGELAEVV